MSRRLWWYSGLRRGLMVVLDLGGQWFAVDHARSTLSKRLIRWCVRSFGSTWLSIAVAALILLLAWTLVASDSRSAERLSPQQDQHEAPSADRHDSCEDAIAVAAARALLPAEVIYAIGRVEAGWRGRIHPWTLSKDGTAERFPDRASTAARLSELLAEGVTNIDVGCLQINLRWHGQDRLDPVALLDPMNNAALAAAHLAALLRETHNDLDRAVGLYHTRKPQRALWYRCRVASEIAKGAGRQGYACGDAPP